MAQPYTTKQGDMIDAIAWAHYGHRDGTAEAILEANYGLASEPPMLPIGLPIVLPDLPAAERGPALIRLWD